MYYLLFRFRLVYMSDAVIFLFQYPGLEPVLDDLLPKKSPLIVAKWFI